MMLKTSLGLLCLGLAAWPAHADTLSWEECLHLASSNNPALRSAEDNFVSAQSQLEGSKSDYFPQLSGTIGYTLANTATVAPGGSSNIQGSTTESGSAATYTASITGSQNVFNGLADYAKIQEAKATLGIAQTTLRTVKAQVSYNLKSAFVGLDVAQKSLDLARTISGRREQNLRMVELRFKDGQENKGNVLLYQAYLKDARFGELQSQDNIVTAQSQLAQAIGRDSYTDLAITGTVPVHEPPASPDPERLATSAPAYMQSVFQVDYDDAAITAARSAFFPTLGVTGTVGQEGPWFPDTNRWSITASLTVPIFNGFHDLYGTRASIDSWKAAELTRSDTAHSSAATIANDYTNYIESIQKLLVDQAYLDAAQVRAAIARADYGNGIMSFQDWDLVETDLITREKNVLQDLQTRVVSEAAWEQAQGKGAIQ